MLVISQHLCPTLISRLGVLGCVFSQTFRGVDIRSDPTQAVSFAFLFLWGRGGDELTVCHSPQSDGEWASIDPMSCRRSSTQYPQRVGLRARWSSLQ